MSNNDIYQSPLSARYASREMQYIFSPDMKFKTWRKLWIALAETELELGLSENGKPVVTQEQIDELKAHAEDINYEVAREREKLVRHDVMSHVYAYGQQCPHAAGIIHLGATSCYVGDNTDVIIMTEAMKLVRKKLINVINELAKFARQYKELPTLAFTHFQPAQPTTVGKRATLWMEELLLDLSDLEYMIGQQKLLGSKGTTGTQASFLELFSGDHEKVRQMDDKIAEKMGFSECYPVSGQTYSRKVDSRILNVLSGIAQSAHKFSNDIRLLQHLKEIEEPFEKNQIGSSAMAYKRNPMRSERIASLANYVIADAMNPAITAATQWFERTLDDSANKRISVPEAFLAVDGILDLYLNVVDGLVVYDKVIYQRFMKEIPFMATENIMMDAVKRGGNRQDLHEKIREHSMAAGAVVKQEGKENDLVDRIAADPAFGMTKEEIVALLEPKNFVGRAPQQTEEFLSEVVQPILDANQDILGLRAEINV
ncbi:MAG: adenylosuccinate lyase [Bacteroides sp.]|nr:adenylosuccinate lyase [Bacteroides sp.]MCM1550165.1 adenylosuccinate lyase [Clostridium sp.]